MIYEKQIEFYKDRTIGERFSAGFNFIKQTHKVLLKNLLIVGIPLALISGYTMQYYMSAYTHFLENFAQGFANGQFEGIDSSMLIQCGLYTLVTFFASILIYSLTGTILIQYEKGELSTETGWSELSKTLFALMKKTFAIIVIMFVFILLIVSLFVFVFSSLGSGGIGIAIFFLLIILAALIAFIPSLCLLFYPAYYGGLSSWESIKKGFSMGFKNWGEVFVAFLLVFVIQFFFSLFFEIPYSLYNGFTQGEVTPIGFCLASISSLGNILVIPLTVIIFSFQYFAITEKEEGISLQSQVDTFDNL